MRPTDPCHSTWMHVDKHPSPTREHTLCIATMSAVTVCSFIHRTLINWNRRASTSRWRLHSDLIRSNVTPQQHPSSETNEHLFHPNRTSSHPAMVLSLRLDKIVVVSLLYRLVRLIWIMKSLEFVRGMAMCWAMVIPTLSSADGSEWVKSNLRNSSAAQSDPSTLLRAFLSCLVVSSWWEVVIE